MLWNMAPKTPATQSCFFVRSWRSSSIASQHSSPPPHAVKEGHELAGEYAAPKHPAHENRQCLAWSEGEHGVDRHDVGQPQLDAGNGNGRENLRFHHKDDEGYGGEQIQVGEFLRS